MKQPHKSVLQSRMIELNKSNTRSTGVCLYLSEVYGKLSYLYTNWEDSYYRCLCYVR